MIVNEYHNCSQDALQFELGVVLYSSAVQKLHIEEAIQREFEEEGDRADVIGR